MPPLTFYLHILTKVFKLWKVSKVTIKDGNCSSLLPKPPKVLTSITLNTFVLKTNNVAVVALMLQSGRGAFQCLPPLHHCRHGPEASMRRMPPPDHRQVPAQSHRLPLARGVRAVRGVRGRAAQLLLSAGLQTLLQAGLCGVSVTFIITFSTRSRE